VPEMGDGETEKRHINYGIYSNNQPSFPSSFIVVSVQIVVLPFVVVLSQFPNPNSTFIDVVDSIVVGGPSVVVANGIGTVSTFVGLCLPSPPFPPSPNCSLSIQFG
jgi:hypothetical protein